MVKKLTIQFTDEDIKYLRLLSEFILNVDPIKQKNKTDILNHILNLIEGGE